MSHNLKAICLATCLASGSLASLAHASDYTEQQLVVIKFLTIVEMAEQNCPGVHLNASAVRLELDKAHLDPSGSAFLNEMEKAAKEVIARAESVQVVLRAWSSPG